jgi:UDP-N-acetylglucosamine diphosphorylase / glucose-1-phosphate thymidylyltransferase / UDP-N-acetylgalactosamine diphosphorylase / glucosamine-1-phosphate N-acetyltransferase / galactosamine-1-phosphate N-acetyltransferase
MKAVILAAGKGIRMMPLTENIPKVLVEVNGKPFLYHIIKSLQKAGYDDFCLIVGYKKDKIADFLKKYKIKAVMIEQKEQKGTGHAVMQAETFAGKENFIVLGGDNLWSVEDLKQMNKEDDYNYISGIKVQNPEKYGVLIEEKGFLKEIKEKPKENFGNLINTGLYKFTPEIFEALSQIKLSPRGEYELTDAITILARQKKVKLIKIKDFWRDLGTIQDIKPMGEFLNKRCHE